MDVPFAVLADTAVVSREGKLSVIGIFDRLRTSSFPAVHPSCVLVVQFAAGVAERGEQKRLTIRLMDEDHLLAQVEGDFTVPDEPGRMRFVVNQIFQIQGLPFPRPGDYAFYVLVNGEEKKVVRLEVQQIPPEQLPAGQDTE